MGVEVGSWFPTYLVFFLSGFSIQVALIPKLFQWLLPYVYCKFLAECCCSVFWGVLDGFLGVVRVFYLVAYREVSMMPVSNQVNPHVCFIVC